MKIAVVDDNRTERDFLISNLKKFSMEYNFEIQTTGYSSGESFLEEADFSILDVVFLDIYLGGITGMEIAKRLRTEEYDGMIVFCTLTAEFALEGYEVKAAGYIVKPFSYERITALLLDIAKMLQERSLCIRIKEKRQWYKVNLCDILYAENHANYVFIYTNSKMYSTRMPFREMQSMLLSSPSFAKCDRGIVINLINVREIKNNIVLMKNGDCLPVSRSNISTVKERYFDFVFEKMEDSFYVEP